MPDTLSTFPPIMIQRVFSVSLRAALAATLVAGVALAGTRDGKVAIKAGRIITLAGPDIENGTIVIDGGRITALGAEVEVPWDVPVIDASHLVAFPGFVEAHTTSGMDRPNENIDVAAFLSIRDSVDPVNQYFENALRAGITTLNVQHGNDCVVGARGMVVKPTGMTIEQMLVKPDSGVKISASPKRGKSRATQMQTLRSAFDELRRYLEGLVQEKRDGKDLARREALYQGRDLEGEKAKGRAMTGAGWTVDGLELVPRGEIDEKQEPLLDIVEGRIDIFFWCGSPAEVARAAAIAEENGFLQRTTFVLSNGCWKAADRIAEIGRPVVLEGELIHTERDPLTGEETETFVPGVFAEKGIEFALSSLNSTTQTLWYQAGLAVAHGLERDAALAAVTTTPAKMLGLGDRVGSFEVGKDGNVLLLTGDPLSVTSWIDQVVIEGKKVYDRAEDRRLKQLLEGIQPPGTDAAAAVDELPADGADAAKGEDDK